MKIVISRRVAIGAAVAVNLVLLLALVLLTLSRSDNRRADELRQLGATEYPEPAQIADFALMDQSGNAFGIDRLQDRWSLVFFGFTSCDDICPLSVVEMNRAIESLQNPRLQAIFVTVDPAIDTPALLGSYLAAFNDSWIGLTGDMGSIQRLASQLYVVIRNQQTDVAAERDMAAHGEHDESHGGDIDHSGHISLIDPQGRLRAVLRPPHRSRDLVAIMEYFL